MDKDNNNGISRRSALKRMGLLVAGAACMWKSQTNLTPLAKKNLPTLFIIRLPL